RLLDCAGDLLPTGAASASRLRGAPRQGLVEAERRAVQGARRRCGYRTAMSRPGRSLTIWPADTPCLVFLMFLSRGPSSQAKEDLITQTSSSPTPRRWIQASVILRLE